MKDIIKEIEDIEQQFRLQLWDNSGKEKYKSNALCKKTDCIIIVFDLTELKSFDSVENWRNNFLDKIEYPENFPFILIGNKSDEVDKRKVSDEKIKEYCKSKSISAYFDTSAKNNINIKEVFEEATKLGYYRVRELQYELNIMNGKKTDSES